MAERKVKVKPAPMPKYRPKGKSVPMPTRPFPKGKTKPAPMPKFEKKKTITVPSDSEHIKKFKGGGIAIRGLGRAFMKGGKV